MILLLMLLSLGIASAAPNVTIYDQGTDVRSIPGGALITGANLTVTIYDAPVGGNVIYNNTFANAIQYGTWDVALSNITLLYGAPYWKDYEINGDNINFGADDRLLFYSSWGDINASNIINTSWVTNSTEIDPLWSANYSLFNTSWSSTYNVTYEGKAAIGVCAVDQAIQNITNSTVECIDLMDGPTGPPGPPGAAGNNSNVTCGDDYLSCDYSNSSYANVTANLTTFDLRYLMGEVDPLWSSNYSLFNDSWSSTYNSTYNALVSDNQTWNETRANSLYYLLTNPASYWNSTFALFNKSYADTLYAAIDEPLWSGNDTSVARIGDCSVNEFVQNTTTTGVECAAPSITETDPRWSGNATAVFNETLWSGNYSLFNTSWSSTYNSTYDAKVTDNQSWNQTLGDSRYAQYQFGANSFNGTGNITTEGNITGTLNASNIINAPWLTTTPYQTQAAGFTNYTNFTTTDKDRGILINTTVSKPACSVAERGAFWIEQGGNNVADYLYACMKNSSNNYNWVIVSYGG